MADPSLALVVGANRGIGLGVVKEMSRKGWSVIATARRPDEAKDLRTLAASNPGKLQILPLDMTNTAQVDGFAGTIAGKKLDAVLINAGTSGPDHMSASQATEAEIGSLMFTNAVAPVRLARTLIGSIREKTGVLAFTSSIMGSVELNTEGYHELYRASKAALNSLTRGLWSEVNGHGITLLSMHPGWVRTDMGGPSAPVSVEQSAHGLVAMIERERGKHRHEFISFTGEELAW
ncbi:MAG: SDR family oxidoreductase [Acetobacteraceae bacterium]|jgi:NAD(P)-dependent dehydrogenase (short-subunit alcohol dehydrogenase family)